MGHEVLERLPARTLELRRRQDQLHARSQDVPHERHGSAERLVIHAVRLGEDDGNLGAAVTHDHGRTCKAVCRDPAFPQCLHHEHRVDVGGKRLALAARVAAPAGKVVRAR